jgi:hypothetical protein
LIPLGFERPANRPAVFSLNMAICGTPSVNLTSGVDLCVLLCRFAL